MDLYEYTFCFFDNSILKEIRGYEPYIGVSIGYIKRCQLSYKTLGMNIHFWLLFKYLRGRVL
jgi:hypothetical protein